jgi:Pirin-related protein
MIRKVSGLIQGKYTYDGAGVKLYRVFGGTSTYHLTDPFLLLDFFGSSNVEDYINGFPWHPHRAESFFTLIEIFLSVYNKFLLINNDLSHRCGLCPKGWE